VTATAPTVTAAPANAVASEMSVFICVTKREKPRADPSSMSPPRPDPAARKQTLPAVCHIDTAQPSFCQPDRNRQRDGGEIDFRKQ
jgi:hypothetical protein